MMSMKELMESKTKAYDHSSDDNGSYYRTDSEKEEPPMEEDSDDFKDVTTFDQTEDEREDIDDPSDTGSHKPASSKRTKRSATRSNGESPAAKKQHSRLQDGGKGRGRGGRTREKSPIHK